MLCLIYSINDNEKPSNILFFLLVNNLNENKLSNHKMQHILTTQKKKWNDIKVIPNTMRNYYMWQINKFSHWQYVLLKYFLQKHPLTNWGVENYRENICICINIFLIYSKLYAEKEMKRKEKKKKSKIVILWLKH